MINITYDIWKETCDLVKKYAKKYGKFYLQLYPFYKYNNLNYISSEKFFNEYVVNGAILSNYNNFDRIDNYCRKSDGSYRNRFLITPIIFLYYISIGLYISKRYKQNRNKEVFVKYGGSFENGELHYRNSYQEFVETVVDTSFEYNYYYKIDIADYFNKIDINILTKRISYSFGFNQKEQMIFKEIFNWCGNGNFPQTECGVTSSYLATIIYFDNIDNKLYNQLSKIEDIKSFKICRYVDDLFIFINYDGRRNTDKIENKICSIYENLIYDYNLSINRKKSKFNKSENIFNDIKSFSMVDEIIEDELISYDYKKHLFDFMSELVSYAEKGGFNYQKYNDLVEKYFDNPDSKYHASQILYTIIYKDINWLEETRILNKLTKIIDYDFNVIAVDPRRLVSLILNTHDEQIINKFLNKLYICAENDNWLISHNFMAMQYLLYRKFVNNKLMGKIEKFHPKNIDFINKYYKNDWRNIVISNDLITNVAKLDYNKFPISFFKFLEIISIKNGNILQGQAYNKNYFDSITKNIELVKNYPTNPNKISYTKNDLKDIYLNNLNIPKSIWNKIDKLCDNRNKNPLCHASCNVFSRKDDLTTGIKKEISSINKLIDEIIRIYV